MFPVLLFVAVHSLLVVAMVVALVAVLASAVSALLLFLVCSLWCGNTTNHVVHRALDKKCIGTDSVALYAGRCPSRTLLLTVPVF